VHYGVNRVVGDLAARERSGGSHEHAEALVDEKSFAVPLLVDLESRRPLMTRKIYNREFFVIDVETEHDDASA